MARSGSTPTGVGLERAARHRRVPLAGCGQAGWETFSPGLVRRKPSYGVAFQKNTQAVEQGCQVSGSTRGPKELSLRKRTRLLGVSSLFGCHGAQNRRGTQCATSDPVSNERAPVAYQPGVAVHDVGVRVSANDGWTPRRCHRCRSCPGCCDRLGGCVT